MSSTRSPLNGSGPGAPAPAGAPAPRPRRRGARRAAAPVRIAQTGRRQAERRPRVGRAVAGVGDEGRPLAEVLDGRARWRRARSVRSGCGRPTPARAPRSTVRSPTQASMVGAERGPLEEQLRVLGPLGVADHRAEVEPLLAGAAPEPDQPVARGADAGRRDEPLLAHRPAELVVERHRVVREAHRRRLEHRHVDELARRVVAPATTPACRWRRRRRPATRRPGRRRARAPDRAAHGRARRCRPTTPAA